MAAAYDKIKVVKTTVTLVLLVMTFSAICPAQITYKIRKAEFFHAVQFAEFGELPRESWEKEFKRFADAGRGYVSSRLYVVIYAQVRTRRTSISSIKKQYEEFLEKSVSEPLSVYVASGGYRKQMTTELWIVSKHDDLPKLTPDEPFKPEKFGEIDDVADEEFLKVMDAFWRKSQAEPNSQGYIINYGSDEGIARRERLITDNINFRRFDRSRITLVRGGDEFSAKTTLWLVPPGASYPAP